MTRIAVIGAGLSGLRAAECLQARGHEVEVFDKARGVGGRMSTRSVDPYQFDFGAQYFTAKSKAFKAFLEPLLTAELIQQWEPLFVELDRDAIVRQVQWSDSPSHYVPAPKMTSLCQYMAENLSVTRERKVTKLKRKQKQWVLMADESDLGTFDWVIVAIPVAQAVDLLPKTFYEYKQLKTINMLGCYALMLGFEDPLDIEWQAALVHNADISWISVNNHKSGRDKAFSLVVHSTNQWAEENMDASKTDIKKHMLKELKVVLNQTLKPKHKDLHRWRYANIDKQSGDKAYVDYDLQLAVCGDWCIQGRVEAAFLSGNFVGQAEI